MSTAARKIRVGHGVAIGGPGPFFLIAGPCVIESRKQAEAIARRVRDVCRRLGIPYVFKASFDKANRSSIGSYRGPGLDKGLAVLREIRESLGVPVLSDVHETVQVERAAEVLDVIQIPAFLCRQTDLLLAAARTGKVVNIKKGQFLAPQDMRNAVEKIESAGNRKIILTERGTTFGYHNLVVDFRSIPVMKSWGYPVVLDAAHGVQQPGGRGTASGGDRELIPVLARAGIAAGADGIFLEVHENPSRARSDRDNALRLGGLEGLLAALLRIRAAL